MWITVVPLVSVLVSATSDDAVVTSPAAAKQKLADTLASASSIDSVSANGRLVSFAITRDGNAFRVDVGTRKTGEVISLAVVESEGRVSEQGGLTWLADELDTTSVTKLVVDDDGAVTIATAAGRKYMAIPGRGSGGNAAVEAQWAAEWDRQVH
jgi:hypothetical protein